MVIFVVLLFVLGLLVTALFLGPVRISFLFDTVRERMSVCARWLGVVKAEGSVVGGRIHLEVRLLTVRIYAGYPKRGGTMVSRRMLLDAADLSGTHVRFSYGSCSPDRTGFFCAASSIVGALLRSADVEIEPVFLPREEFLTVAAETRLNAGKTLLNLIAAPFRMNKPKRA